MLRIVHAMLVWCVCVSEAGNSDWSSLAYRLETDSSRSPHPDIVSAATTGSIAGDTQPRQSENNTAAPTALGGGTNLAVVEPTPYYMSPCV